MTSDTTGIHSDWGKVLAVAQQEQCSVVSERKRREGGRKGMETCMEGRGEEFSTSRPSLDTNPEVERCHNKPGTNGELIFPSGGQKELGMVAKRSSP